METRRLLESDDRSGFQSGDAALDTFFSRYAGQNQFRHRISTTYIALDGGRIAGFATVAAGELQADDLPEASRRALPRYPLPILRLARLAVSRDLQGRGVGAALLRTVFALAKSMAAATGCIGVVVDAKPDSVSYYEERGFLRLEGSAGLMEGRPRPIPMFLSLEEIPDS